MKSKKKQIGLSLAFGTCLWPVIWNYGYKPAKNIQLFGANPKNCKTDKFPKNLPVQKIATYTPEDTEISRRDTENFDKICQCQT